jgi:hypothetical protein
MFLQADQVDAREIRQRGEFIQSDRAATVDQMGAGIVIVR